MSSFEYQVSGNTFDKVAGKLRNITAKQIGTVARKTLIDVTLENNWRRFKSAIKQASIDEDTEMVFIADLNNARQIASYLNFGTPDHFVKPVNAKALHWTSGGQDFFSKGHRVSGIKAYDFWKIEGRVSDAVLNFTNQRIKKAYE